MAGARLPAVRMSQVVAGQLEAEEDDLGSESVVVEIPPSSKFGFAWPTEQPSPAPLPAAAERPVTLSSSEGETDVSEDEPSEPVRHHPKSEDFGDDSDFITPTSHLNLEHNPMDQAGPLPPPRRLSRAFSMPLPSQLSSLNNPRRSPPSSGNTPDVVEKAEPELEHFRELSLELADSVQMVIQTLLQLSPPQVFDPAKEQFSACSLSIPTPSICAMFTSMKNLNYMSANMSALSYEAHNAQGTDTYSMKIPFISTVQSEFDVGEMLQSVGDALSGVAAQAAVDLVLFHGDVGMKHIAVRGDENGLSYALSHISRQVIGVASPGDTVEIGLFIEPFNDSQSTSPNGLTDGSALRVESPSLDNEGLLRCVFHVSLRYAAGDNDKSNGSNVQGISHTSRPRPCFNTIILRRLLRHIGATLDTDIPLKSSFVGYACRLSVIVEAGEPSAVNPSVSVSHEDTAVLGFPDMHISSEPTLDQLLQFTETLRGRNATLYASSKGSFAHHLSSYLTAWGMNVSHMSTEPDGEGEYEQWGDELGTVPVPPLDLSASQEGASSTSSPTDGRAPFDALFVLIDDDVAVLRSRLLKIKSEQAYPLSLHSRKRPSLASNHRPRSSPQVSRVLGITNNSAPQSHIVIVHFTSLSNFKLVKDAIQSIFAPVNGVSVRVPEVIVIPKPAGPRRFLTALHTAVTRPVVDPFFVPTATSPMSPGLYSNSPFFNFSNAPKSPGGRSSTSGRAGSEKPMRSPKDSITGELTVGHAPPSPLSQSEGIEYFSDAVVKLGATPATGLIIQSPDGQPTGIFFHPKGRSASNSTLPPSPKMEPTKAQEGREREPVRQRTYRIPSGRIDRTNKDSGVSSSSSAPALRAAHSTFSLASEGSEEGTPTSTKGKGRVDSFNEDRESTIVEPSLAVSVSTSPDASPAAPRGYMIRQASHTSTTSPPSSPQLRSPTWQSMSPRRGRRMVAEHTPTSPSSQSKKSKTGASEGKIVPPISVLIVDDNPINITILSTFMKKRRIKYDVAKNGEEAVDKWRSGVFHLILMDIQMPVMDGIQATKEIRRIEKQNAVGAFPSTPQSEGQRTPSETSTSDSRSATPAYRSSVIIVALTASSLQADRVAALAAGCNDFLTKPVSLDWLNSKIIEWGSIKALQMWADIRPDVVRSITTGQTAQAQQVARRLHVPEGRSASTTGGLSSRSSSAKRSQQENSDMKSKPSSGSEWPFLANVSRSDPSAGPSSQTSNAIFASTSSSYPAISSMSANEAAMTLASAHKPQVPVAGVQIPVECLVAAVESAVPSPSEGATPATVSIGATPATVSEGVTPTVASAGVTRTVASIAATSAELAATRSTVVPPASGSPMPILEEKNTEDTAAPTEDGSPPSPPHSAPQ